MKSSRANGILYAMLAALFYALNVPFAKLLLSSVPSTYMAAFLYLGAGAGVGIMYIFHLRSEEKSERLTGNDLPYVIGMIVLDILAPIFLMIGINMGTAANASLLGNFEIVATTVIALLIFKEKVSGKLWIAIVFIIISSIILTFEGADSLQFSYGSLFVILGTCCWGLENNCTRSISGKSTYEIVTLKGLFSGTGAFMIAVIIGEKLPEIKVALMAMLLGFVAFGLSIFTYIRAQRSLGAAKTSAYYALAPFIGVFLSITINKESLSVLYILALIFMAIGTGFTVSDTLINRHAHSHIHSITHKHGGSLHTHIIEHSHIHSHIFNETDHYHRHRKADKAEHGRHN